MYNGAQINYMHCDYYSLITVFLNILYYEHQNQKHNLVDVPVFRKFINDNIIKIENGR
jgi:hypothetical protein